jgi:hypothetical protein
MSDQPGALAPKFAPVGPTVTDDVRRLISRYGSESVKQAIKQLTKPKRGRKPEKDWLLLAPYLKQDVADWLDGRDPIELRSHYAVANAVAADHPGHNQTATAARVMRKLSAKRRWMFLASALSDSETASPYNTHLRTLSELSQFDDVWSRLLDYAERDVERFREIHGEPAAEMTMEEIKRRSQNVLTPFRGPNSLASLLGLSADAALRK